MYCEMNMETGKYEMVRYECGDLFVDRYAPTERFVLLVKETNIGYLWRYFLFDENRPNVIYAATTGDLKILFKPYIESTGFYK